MPDNQNNTQNINEVDSAQSLNQNDKILISNNQSAVKKVNRDTLAYAVLEEYSGSQLAGKNQTVTAAVGNIHQRLDYLEKNGLPEGTIDQAVSDTIAEYIQSGEMTNLTIADHSLPRSKVNSAFEATLAKADGAMQTSVYDPNGYGIGSSAVDPYTFAQRQDTAKKREIVETDTYTVVDSKNTSTSYTGLANALNGVLNRAEAYADNAVGGYTSMNIQVVSALPDNNIQENTFYLIPKESGNGYDKYWYITDQSGNKKWDNFGSSSTVVVSTLPTNPDPGVDYILASNGQYQFYKWINNAWALVAGGSPAVTIDVNYPIHLKGNGSPTVVNLSTDISNRNRYYLDISAMKIYKATEGISSVTWDLFQTLVETPDSNKDYFLKDTGIKYWHFRYDGTNFYMVGSDGYSKEEIDQQFEMVNYNISTNSNGITSLGSSLATLRQTVENIDTEGATYSAGISMGDNETYLFTLYETKNDVQGIASQFALPATGGGGSSSTTFITMNPITQSPLILTPSDRVIIQVDFSDVDSNNWPVDASYTLERETGASTTIVMSGDMIQGVNSFDVTDYCLIDKQKFNLRIVDDAGSTSFISWRVQIVDVGIQSTFNDKYAYPANKPVKFSYVPFGSTTKTVHFKLDGQELPTVSTNDSGTAMSYDLPAQSHGAHMLECWITAEINNTPIETNHIFKDIIWYDNSETTPVIGCAYRYDYYGSISAQQYDTTSIPYVVYDPRSSAPEVTLKIDDEVYSTLRATSASNTWAYKSEEVAQHILTISCGSVSVDVHINIEELDFDVSPVTGNLEFDFNPVGYSNTSENRLWKDKENPNIQMTVSENFDWHNGGYQLDENGNQYFCVKAGTNAYINYNLFEIDPKQTGAEFKLVFKTTNVRDADATFFTCLPQNEAKVGLEMNVHNANVYTSGDALYIPYCEEDIIEFEYNINPLDLEDPTATSYIMSYEDGVGLRALIYKGTDRLYQYQSVPITIGSEDCDVHIYRIKAYSAALTDKNILDNFIADARDAETIIDRYRRNQIYTENNELTPDSVAIACPDLRIIKIDCPHFTTDKSDYIKNTNVECIYKGGDPILDNWKFVNGYHAGQGTTSNTYGYAGRNIDIIFGFDGQHQVVSKIPLDENYITELTLGDNMTKVLDGSGKVSLTRNSVPNDWFNIKVNIASSENANNALLQRRYNTYLPYKTPGMKRDPKIKNSMEFANCVVFLRENDPDINTHTEFQDTNWHFYAIGNIGDSKKTDNTRVNDPHDLKEFVIEVSDNTLPNSQFDTGVYYDSNGNITYDYRLKAQNVYPITRQQWEATDGYVVFDNPNQLIKQNLPILYEKVGNNYVKTSDTAIDSSKTYYKVNYLNKKYEGLNVDIYTLNSKGKAEITSGWDSSFEFRYDMGTKDGETISSAEIEAQQIESKQVWRDLYEFIIMSSDEDFVSHLGDWFIVESPLYWYLFTERYTMIDSRAKNTFYHYGKTYISQAEAAEMGDEARYYTIDDAAAAINNGYRFDLWDYDNDTALGINNQGELTLTYGFEDTDYRERGNPASDWAYNAAENTLWRRISRLMGSRLQSMYTNRESEGCWSATSLINQFDAWQNQFPEELWRLDIERKYIRTYHGGAETYLKSMMNGRKKYQRRQYERDQDIYIGSKYLGARILADNIQMRINKPQGEVAVAPDYTIEIVPYSDMYLSVRYGNSGEVQQYRLRAGQKKDFTTTLTDTTNTQILIYPGSRIQALNDLSACYVDYNDFSSAEKLKTLIIGSNVEGYENRFLTYLTLKNNTLLEKLDVRNCPNLTGSINLSSCPNLKEFYAEGTSITSALFARNGKIEIAHLPETINNLTLLDLYYLDDLIIPSYENLEEFVCEHSTVDELSILQAAINTLQVVRLLDVNWQLPSTELLNRVLQMNSSLLTGYAYISGIIRTSELNAYNAKWPEFIPDHDPHSVVQQYHVTYVNDDDDETVLWETDVDQGSYPVDPVANGTITTPTKPMTDQYIYTYDGWEGLDAAVFEARTIKVKYTATVRTYTVRWYSQRGGTLLKSLNDVAYGTECVFLDEDHPLPVRKEEEAIHKYHLFAGWDKSTGYVTNDMDVYAKWDSCGQLPVAGTPMNEMRPSEIYAICKAGVQDQDGRFEALDYVDITLGRNYDFDNVESIEFGEDYDLPGIDRDQYVSGGFYFDGTKSYTTDIKLFAEDSPSFTMAIDFQFNGNSANQTLFSTDNAGLSDGLRLDYTGSYPRVIFGDQSVTIGMNKMRSIAVIRHQAGSRYLQIYGMDVGKNYSTYQEQINKRILVRSSFTYSDEPITFGAVNYPNGARFFGKGTIHWCKIWFADLGETMAYEIASWPREKIRMEYWGPGNYYYADSNQLCRGTWICNHIIGGSINGYTGRVLPTWQNEDGDYVDSWHRSRVRKFIRNVVFNAFPPEWQSAIANVEVNTSSNGTAVIPNNENIYLLAYAEAITSSSYSYGLAAERGPAGKSVPWLNGYFGRAKFVFPRTYTQTFTTSSYSDTYEPSVYFQTTVEPFSLWYAGSDTYIFLPQALIDQYGLSVSYTANPDYSQNAGGWLRCGYWQLRSSCDYRYNYSDGTVRIQREFFYIYSYYSETTTSYALVPVFSI